MWCIVGQRCRDVSNEVTERGGGAAVFGPFVSNYTHALDPKRRLTIPSEWRESVGSPRQLFVLPASGRRCLLCYPARDMARHLEKLRALHADSPRQRQLARAVLASMSDLVSWDSQGRIRIKDELLAFAELKGQVFLTGNFDGFELWNPQRWEEITRTADRQKLLEATEQLDW